MNEFKHLANQIIGLPPPFLLSYFLFGLSMKICQEVLALQPISLPQATTLAKLQEDKLHDHYRSHKVTPPYNHHQPISLAPPPSPNSRQSFVHRTLEEMVLRREKGLCYNCDEKWSSSHKCRGRILLLIIESNEAVIDTKEDIDFSLA